jgi:hypothetical protein
MTNNSHPFKEYSDILSFYESSPNVRSPTKKINSNLRRCLQCKIPLSSSNLGPYCSPSCMQAHDSGQVHKPDSNIMRHFSKVMDLHVYLLYYAYIDKPKYGSMINCQSCCQIILGAIIRNV